MYSNMIKMLMGFTSQRRQSLLPWDLFCQTKEEKGFALNIRIADVNVKKGNTHKIT